MATRIWVNIAFGTGFLPDGTKPLSDPMLSYDNDNNNNNNYDNNLLIYIALNSNDLQCCT